MKNDVSTGLGCPSSAQGTWRAVTSKAREEEAETPSSRHRHGGPRAGDNKHRLDMTTFFILKEEESL